MKFGGIPHTSKKFSALDRVMVDAIGVSSRGRVRRLIYHIGHLAIGMTVAFIDFMTKSSAPLAIHPFETAGLGLAPFRCIDVIERVFVACQGASRQPGGSCAFCARSIMACFVIKSRDDKRFEVGCDCVERTLTACARTDAEKIARQLHDSCNRVKTARANARKDARIAAAVSALAENYDALDATIYDGVVQHSHGPRSVAAQAEWMLGNGGRTLKMRGAELVEACLAPGDA